MSAFQKELFSFHGGYLTYSFDGRYRFVARFKYSTQRKLKTQFVKDLIAFSTPEAYFYALEVERKTPMDILYPNRKAA